MPDRERRIVVVLCRGDRHARGHERATHAEIARRLAAIKGCDFAGEYDPQQAYAASLYFVPSDTLPSGAAQALGIAGEEDLFGGVVPYPFVADKAISHCLVAAEARAPAGWSHEFGCRVHGAVLRGFTVFSRDDACRAGRRLLERGPVRIKPVRATAGYGQSIVTEPAGLETVLQDSAGELSEEGLVLEPNLTEVTTYSVGQLRVSDRPVSYYGTQKLTRNNSGASVYGGSDLVLMRGGFDDLLRLDMAEPVRLAVSQARSYDSAAMACFPGLLASRRNYDVLQGLDPQGRPCSGVLEQSWRIGGASTAEILALEKFQSDPTLHAVRAACFEIYGDAARPPPDATVFFRGADEKIGPIIKYARIMPYDDA